MVSVRCFNKSYTVNVPPMSNVEAVIDMVASLALSPAQRASFDPTNASSVRLILPDKGKVDSGKVLERGVPWRYLNVPAGASLVLVTGMEVVLGAQDARASASASALTSADRQPEPTAPTAPIAPTAPTDPVAPAVPRTSATAPATSTSAIVDGVKYEDMYLFRATEVASAPAAWNEEVDYEVSQRDAMLMQSSLAKKTKTLTSGTLMTQKMRDEERRRKLASLPSARIRIEFGGAADHLVVQLDLPAAATLDDLYAVVRCKVFETPTAFSFKLMDCTPPRRALEPKSSVSAYEAGLWPAARLAIDSLERCGQPVDMAMLEGVFAPPLLQRKGAIPAPRSGTVDPSSGSAAAAAPTAAATSETSKSTSKSRGVPKWFKT